MQTNLAGPRYKHPVSDAELKRRLDAVQAAMKAEDLDCIITQNHCGIFDSGIRYFVDAQTGGYSSALMIPQSGGMVYLTHGPDNDNAPIRDRNVEKAITKPYCQPFGFSDTMAAEVIEKQICARGFKRIGFWGMQCISFSFGEYLKNALPEVEFSDFSDQVRAITALKSAEEWELIEGAVRAHEHLAAALPVLIRPGRMEFEVRADLERMALQIGAEYIGNVAVGSARPGEISMFVPHFNANRRIQAGDTVTAMIEISGPGGMYGELARICTLGEPSESLRELFSIARGAQDAVAAAAKPGVTGGDLNRVFDEYVTAYGLEPNARFVGHGQGYDMMESPAICAAETMKLKEDMYFAIHPELIRGGDFATACDNYRITKDGAVRITRTPQEIIRIEI